MCTTGKYCWRYTIKLEECKSYKHTFTNLYICMCVHYQLYSQMCAFCCCALQISCLGKVREWHLLL